MNLDLLIFVVELESFFLSSHTHTERKGKMKSWEDPAEIGERRLYTQVMSEACVPVSHLGARHGSQGFETSAFLAKIQDGFAVEGRGIQSHGSQETQPQLMSPRSQLSSSMSSSKECKRRGLATSMLWLSREEPAVG